MCSLELAARERRIAADEAVRCAVAPCARVSAEKLFAFRCAGAFGSVPPFRYHVSFSLCGPSDCMQLQFKSVTLLHVFGNRLLAS